ncbi:hypothetical protein KFK09_023945 [Dendrobium nobile]|uniref:Uncharacterized protein n=1 Tax=Dendrobium nobile TaxID=94219 RepID=A0A8T3ACD5_DENNO|nr:hypothetical protein KFK09_023945 [Dendrobium nobile]
MAAVAGEWQIPMEARKEVQKLATAWDDVEDSRALEVVPLKGAMTNEVFQIRWPVAGGEKSRNVLLRMYGEGVAHFFDRANEIKTFEFMSRHGHGPRLLACFLTDESRNSFTPGRFQLLTCETLKYLP